MLRRLSILVLACWCMGAIGAPRVGADCAVSGLVPRMLTPTTTSLPRDGGGIVVGMRNAAGEGQGMPAGVQLSRGRRSQDLMAQALAPGLVRFAAVSRLRPGTWSAPALGPTVALTVGRTPMPGVPTRPVVIELRRLASTGMSARRTPRSEVRATLEFPVPVGIVAIVTSWGEAGAPATWEPAIQGQREVVVWQEAARCQSEPAGTLAPPEGAGVVGRIAYVDAFGQISPPSAPVPLQ